MNWMYELEEEMRMAGFRIWLVLIGVTVIGGIGTYLYYFIQELTKDHKKKQTQK